MDDMTRERTPSAGIVVPAILILVAAAALYDTTGMVDPDSYIFPRMVAIALIVLAGVQIAATLIGDTTSPRVPIRGSSPRRIGFVVAMLAAVALIPILGFLVAALLAYGATMAIAMHESWSGRARIVYPITGLTVVLVLYWVFRLVLQVPLPRGQVF